MSWKQTKPQKASGSGSSGSVSSSFLDLKAQLERSKTCSSTSSHSDHHKRKPYDLELDRQQTSSSSSSLSKRKKLSSSFFDSASTSSSSKSHKSRPNKSPLSSTNNGSTSSSSGSKKRDKNTDRSDDGEADSMTAAQLATIRRNLERKAKIYSRLQAGKYAGVSSDQLKEGSIDWQRKLDEQSRHPHHHEEEETEAEEESSTTTTTIGDGGGGGGGGGGDEGESMMIEYVDEFGRTRISHINDIPRDLLPSQYGGDKEQDAGQTGMVDNAIYGPATEFPVFDPFAHRHLTQKYPRLSPPQTRVQEQHFDPEFDNTRSRGAAFYKFSANPQEREVQMQQLKRLRHETLIQRQRNGTTTEQERDGVDRDRQESGRG